YKAIEEITDGKEYFALIDSSEYFKMDADALKFAAMKENIGKRKAAAHYNLANANKLTTDFFRNFYKPSVPIQTFNSKEEALNWLLSQN
ncbi:MAG TPA: hypothetical protein VFJ43_07845, partial [Bacteroidia bacterium]|nr:hypothetical protein [Bacteroidia bacterium]